MDRQAMRRPRLPAATWPTHAYPPPKKQCVSSVRLSVAWVVQSSTYRLVCRTKPAQPCGRVLRLAQGKIRQPLDTGGKSMHRRVFIKQLAFVAMAVGGLAIGQPALAADTIKV